MFNGGLLILSGPCVPYSEKACNDAGSRLGLQLGGGTEFAGGHYPFAKDYYEKGCHVYTRGPLANMVFFGTGGTQDQMKTNLYRIYEKTMYRPGGHDCEGKIHITIIIRS